MGLCADLLACVFLALAFAVIAAVIAAVIVVVIAGALRVEGWDWRCWWSLLISRVVLAVTARAIPRLS